jgi:alkylation response protein AidB-like acyl-CoA dehydrogenase
LSQSFVHAARALAPAIEAAADEIEACRQLPPALVEKLVEAGMFRLLVPARHGGAELDLPTHVQVIEELARADGSVAWCVGQANGLCSYMSYAEPAVLDVVFGEGGALLANGPGERNRPGRAVPCDGGYTISGRWMFASGIGHAKWLLAICDVADGGGARLMLVPKDSATLHDVWHVSGLRGTGSQSFSMTDVFVPFDHAIRVEAGTQREPGPLYLFSSSGVFGPTFGSVALGLAHTSLCSLVDMAAGKVPRGMDRSMRENPRVQLEVAQASARLQAARTYLHAILAAVWQRVTATGVLTLDDRVKVRLAATHATHEATFVVDTAYSLAGSGAIFASAPFERRFRDIHAVMQQLQARKSHYENVGAYLLGLEPQRTFL